MTKANTIFRYAMLKMFNRCAEEERIPLSYMRTSLTQLKKPKGAMYELGGYRYIHTKVSAPRTLESLMTERLKPVIYSSVTAYSRNSPRGAFIRVKNDDED